MTQLKCAMVVLLGLVAWGCQPTSEPPKPPSSKSIPPTPIPPTPEPEPAPDPTENSPLHLVFQQLGGSISLHPTYFGAVIASGRVPFYRIDAKGLTPDPSLARGLHTEIIHPPIKSIRWDNDTSAVLVASTVTHTAALHFCKRQAERWHCDDLEHIDLEGNPIHVAPLNSQGPFLSESEIPWGDQWVNDTSIFHKKYLSDNMHHANPPKDDEEIEEALLIYDFKAMGYCCWEGLPRNYRLKEGEHFTIESFKAKPAPIPVRSPQIPGCTCESALCGEFRGKTFPKTQEMIAIGRHCDGSLAAERWLPKKLVPVVEKLPNADKIVKRSTCPKDPNWEHFTAKPPCPFHLVALAHDNIYVTATLTDDGAQPRPYLAHFDGNRWKDLSPHGAKGFVHSFQRHGDDLVLILSDGSLWFGSRQSPSWIRSTPNAKGFEWLKRAPDGSYWAAYSAELFYKDKDHWKKLPLPHSQEPTHKGERYNAVNVAWLPDGSPIVHGRLGDEERAEHVVLSAQPPKEVWRTSNLRQLQAPKVFGTVTIATPQCGEAIFAILKELDADTPEDSPYLDVKNKLESGIRTLGSYMLVETNDNGTRYLVVLTRDYNTWVGVEEGLLKSKLPIQGTALCGDVPPIHRPIYRQASDEEDNERFMSGDNPY